MTALLQRGLRSKARRFLPENLSDAFAARGDDVLLVDWVNRGPVKENWGDAIAPVLAERLSGKRVVNQRDVLNLSGRPVYTTIGSMLGTIDTPHAVVWGTGFVDTKSELQQRPARVCAVRGPRSRAKLLAAGVECPEVFGDPALLAPRFWPGSTTKRHQLGIIPHFKDTAEVATWDLGSQDGVHLIDIRGSLEQVVEEITSCERIASGSLHGLVAADAYGIPATWIQFSTRAFGDGFKFRDYLEAAGGRPLDPLEVDASTSVDEIGSRIGEAHMEVDLDAFVAACPFLDPAALPAAG